MKRLNIISIITAAVAFGFASCADEAEEFQKGAVDVATCYGVYFPAQKTNVILDPSEPTVDTILVARTKTEGAITVPYTLKDANNIFVASELKFEDGQTESYIALAFDSAKVGVTYKLSIAIEDPNYASQYTSNAIAIDIAVTREKWNSLGMASYADYWFVNKSFDVEILQNDNDPNKYRLIDAYKEIVADWAASGYPTAEPTSVFEFQVLKPGDEFADVTITKKGLIAYPFIHTGCVHPSYNDEILLLHPCNFTNHATEDTWAFNKVLQYQENGLPAGIQIAPYYYMMSVGGWNYADADADPTDGGIQFIFPGAVLTDYSLTITQDFAYAGEQDVAFAFGADVAFADFGTYEGALNASQIDSKLEGILAGTDTTVVRLDSSSVVTLVFPATGQYTVVAVSYDADSVPQTAESLVLNYVAKGDDVPVDIVAELVSTKKYERTEEDLSSDNYLEYSLFGSDLVDVKVGLFPSMKFNATPADYLKAVMEDEEEEYTVDAKILEQINGEGYTDLFVDLNPGTEYTLLVIASNGYEQAFKLATATTTGDPLPIYMDFDYTYLDDDLCPATSAGFEGTYDFFAKVNDNAARQPISSVTIKALNDSIVYAKGFMAQLKKFGFNDSICFFFEDGYLYSLATTMDKLEGGSYYAALRYYNGKSIYPFTYDYLLLGGFIDKDHIVFVDDMTGADLTGWMVTAYSDSTYATKVGDFVSYEGIMLTTPGIYDELFASGVQKRVSALSSALRAPRSNYVETERGYIKSTIKNLKNAPRIVSCGTSAGYAITPEPRSVAAKVVAVKALKRDHPMEQAKTIRY